MIEDINESVTFVDLTSLINMQMHANNIALTSLINMQMLKILP